MNTAASVDGAPPRVCEQPQVQFIAANRPGLEKRPRKRVRSMSGMWAWPGTVHHPRHSDCGGGGNALRCEPDIAPCESASAGIRDPARTVNMFCRRRRAIVSPTTGAMR